MSGLVKMKFAKKPLLRKRHRRIVGANEGLQSAVVVKPSAMDELLGLPSIDDIRRERAALELAERMAMTGEVVGLFSPINPRSTAQAREAKREELARRRELNQLLTKWQEPVMTVSLYKSASGGSTEIVVQTNAQTLDVFIAGLTSALYAALVKEAQDVDCDRSEAVIASTLKNAFPIAFAIAGYKAEKVSESKMLTCGFASPDASELLAQSKS